ncbi:MAG TPA: aminopeptidase [Chloroflexia bacterium]|nr:aminopeptidase [Chloroflexia bacterium]
MTDPRVTALADVLIGYSTALQPGQTIAITGPPPATPLLLALYRRALEAGGHPYILADFPETTELLLRHGNDAQLAHVSPLMNTVVDEFDSIVRIIAPANTRTLSGADPGRQRQALSAQRELRGRMMGRMTDGRHHDLITLFPTAALAQEADMSLSDYENFVFGACRLDQPDPVAAWREQSAAQQRVVEWLAGKERMHITGPDIDLELGIGGRGFVNADGKVNFPDGEVFTSPVEDATRGHVKISYPAVFNAREVNQVELWFDAGRLVKYTAAQGYDFLDQMLNTDEGARRLGEIAIGTNPDIRRFTKNTLLDEKIAGTIHMALGQSFAHIGGRNQSALHWDMVTDMTGGQITVDGTLIYQDGAFVL